MLLFLLAPVLLVCSVSISGSGRWAGEIPSVYCVGGGVSMGNCEGFYDMDLALWVGNVQVPNGSLVTQGYINMFCNTANSSIFVENTTDSIRGTSLSDMQYRPWGSHITYNFPYDTEGFDVTNLTQSIISMNGWMSGNGLAFLIKQQRPGDPAASCLVWYVGMTIFYKVQGVMTLQDLTLVPMAGNWASSLNATSFSTTLRVGILNMAIVNPFYFTTTDINVTNGFISNGQFTFNCLNLQLSGDKRNLTCDLPCAPGTGYKLTVGVCFTLQSSIDLSWNISNPFCTNYTANGTINFPDPVLMPGTLLAEERPYGKDAGWPNATATSQLLSTRNKFIATLGVQHLCMTNLSQWATFQLGNSSIACTKAPMDPPQFAVDFSTLLCTVPACNDSACPERTPMYIAMRYMNSTTMITKDSLVYPTFPVILSAGCEDVIGGTTTNCPLSGGVWMNITMSQSSGYIGVSVRVGELDCTNVSVSSSYISCLLPTEAGIFRPVVVSSGDYISSPFYISYSPPKIIRLEGGVGCVPDDSFLNNTNEVCSTDVTFSAAVTMCNRNGSALVPLTIIGENFAGSNVPVTLKLQGAPINVVKDSQDPDTKLYFYLPPGPGGGVRIPLTVIVGLQFDGALVTYEPCFPGQDAHCVACAVGRYRLETPVCELCQKGRYQPKPGQLACELCPKGTYQPAVGQASCIPCPEQMTSAGVGADSSKACNPCPLTHYFDPNNTECLRCAPNSIPHERSCGCVSGFFDDRAVVVEGDGTSLNCQPCPSGANCQKTGTRLATMGPLAGWWRSGLDTFAQCLEPVNCVGVEWGAFLAANSSSSSSMMCVSHRSGVLCAECEQGYQPSSLRGGPCVPCESSSMAWVWASVVIVLLLIALLSVGFYCYRKRQIRKLHAEMAASIAPSPFSSPFSSPTQSPTNSLSTSPVSASPTAQQQPVVRQYGSVVPELLTKTKLLTQKKARDTTSTIVSTSKILIGFLQILSSMVTGNVSLPTTFAQVARVFSFLNFDFMPWASIRCVFHIDFYSRIYLSCLYPFLIVGLLLLCVGLPVAFSNKRDFQDEETFRSIRSQFWTQTVTLALFCVFLLYPWVTLQLLQFGICLRVDDKYYLVADMSQLCLEGEWLSHLGPVIGLFLLLSVGIPATLGSLLYRSRGRLRTKHVRQRLGFLYLAYANDCWWFEIVELATRVCLISIVRCFDPTLHAPLRMICCLIYVVAVLLLKPFVYHSLDSLSLLCMVELMLVACLGHLLPVVGEWQGTFVDDLLSALMLTLFFVFLLYTLFQVMRATRWLSHRPWVQRLLHKTPEPSDLQLGALFKESNQSSEADDSWKDTSVQQSRVD